MSPTVNADGEKDRFDSLQPDDLTQSEFVAELLDAYEIVEDSHVDMDAVLEMIDLRLGTQVELASYRGAKSAIEKHNNDD